MAYNVNFSKTMKTLCQDSDKINQKLIVFNNFSILKKLKPKTKQTTLSCSPVKKKLLPILRKDILLQELIKKKDISKFENKFIQNLKTEPKYYKTLEEFDDFYEIQRRSIMFRETYYKKKNFNNIGTQTNENINRSNGKMLFKNTFVGFDQSKVKKSKKNLIINFFDNEIKFPMKKVFKDEFVIKRQDILNGAKLTPFNIKYDRTRESTKFNTINKSVSHNKKVIFTKLDGYSQYSG